MLMCYWSPSSSSRAYAVFPLQLVTRMGLFGLGIPEVAVIAGIAVLVFGKPKVHSKAATTTYLP